MIEKSALFSHPGSRIRSSLTAALAAGVLMAAAGCSSTQTEQTDRSDGADPQPAPRAAGWEINHSGWAELGYQWEWTGYPPLQPGAAIAHATAYDDLLTFMGTGSTVSVLEASTGKVRWSRQLDRATTRFVEPVRRDETLYAASDTELWELELRNGNTIDRDPLGTLVNTSPLLMGNLAIFGTLSGELFAWQMDNDFKLWSYKFDGPIQQPPIQIDNTYLAALSQAGDLRVLEAVNAHSRMTARIAGGSEAELLTDGIGIYIASLDQSLYAFDAEDGFRFWRVRSSAPVMIQHTLHEGVIYATNADNGLMAINSATGDIMWNNPEIGGWALTVVDGNELIVWSGVELMAVDKDRGDVIARMPLGDISGLRTDSLNDGDLYVITHDGSVARFGRR